MDHSPPPDDRHPDDRQRTSRRRLLRSGLGLVLTLPLAGCVEEMGGEFPPNRKAPVSEMLPSLPVRERTEILAERIAALSANQVGSPGEFADLLQAHDVDVESAAEQRGVLVVAFVQSERMNEGPLHDIGSIAGAYAALVGSGFETEAAEVTVLDPESTSFGAAEIPQEWAVKYDEGDLSATEYGELTATTIESRRVPPEVEVSPND